MQHSAKISERVWWLGVNDRRKHLFENMWPLPNGVSYNSYLIADEKSALLDTIECGSDGAYLARIEEILGGRTLDYLVVNHMELDHAGEIDAVLRRWPAAKIVGNAKTFKVLEAYFNGWSANFVEIKDGEVLDLGQSKLQFVLTPWVHWPETMMSYEASEQILFSGDAFGTFGTINGGVLDSRTRFEFYEEEMRRYYSNIVGKYSGMVQKAFAKLAGVPIRTICSLHGPVWQANVEKVISLYDRWSRYEADPGVVVAYASMYGNTARMADHIAMLLADRGVRDIVVHDASKTHISYLINDIWKYRGVVLGSCAYNSEMFPRMEALCREMSHMQVKNKVLGLFGSYSWNGGGVRNLQKWAEEIGWEQPAAAVEMHGRPTPEKFALCDALADAMAARLSE